MRRTTVLKLVITEENPSYNTLEEKNEFELKDLLLTLLMFPSNRCELDIKVESVRNTPIFPVKVEIDNSKDL